MKVSYNWLKEFLPDLKISPKEVADILTFLGLEVELIEPFEDDTIFDVEVTTNRPDCLSILGVARELSTKLRIPLKIPEVRVEESKKATSDLTSVTIEVPDLCPRYMARLVFGVKVAESPEWLKKALQGIGVRPVNNVVDVTNYVAMELGEPLHAFDFDELFEHRIVVRLARPGEEIRAIDGRIYPLKEDTLVIADGKFPVAIAGVIGGKDTEVTDRTKNILLESGFFDPISVRRTSKSLSLTTAASYRFSRGVDYDIIPIASLRAAALIKEVAGGKILSSPIDEKLISPTPRKMSLRFHRIKTILGFDISPDEAEQTLNLLGFSTIERTPQEITVDIPARRADVEEEVHLIEEVGRIHGFENIPLVELPVVATKTSDEYEVLKRIREILWASGFCEVMSDVFVKDEGLINGFSFLSDAPPIFLRNPLRADEPCLRKSLIPALLKIYAYNQDYAGKNPELFEISKVFINKDGELPYEPYVLAIVTSLGYENLRSIILHSLLRKHNPRQATPLGYERLRGVIDTLFERLGISVEIKVAEVPIFAPECSAKILLSADKKELGIIGVLRNDIKEEIGVRDPLFVAEINLSEILPLVSLIHRFHPIPKTPEVLRDIAVVVDEEILWGDIKTLILNSKTPNLRSVELFDIYRGKQIPQKKKSLAIRLHFLDPERTLRSEEVDKAVTVLIEKIKKQTGALVRGLDIQ